MSLAVAKGVITAIGVLAKVLKIYEFANENFGNQNSPDVVNFSFKVGLDGAGASEGAQPMKNAGGNIPDIRVYNEVGQFLGQTINDKRKCGSGQDNCQSSVGGVNQQPTYTLFTGNNDAICLAWIGVTYPGGDRYAWVGNWGQQCGAPWYYSDIYIQSDTGADKVTCTWLDGNGDTPVSALQVHWPEFREGYASLDSDPNYYCSQLPGQTFYWGGDIDYISYWGPRGEIRSSKDPRRSLPLGMGTGSIPDQTLTKRDHIERFRRSQANDSRLIKSKATSHSAQELCDSPYSVGPSFVSLQERLYCDMPSKKVYPFCDDVEQGACWMNDLNTVLWKGKTIKADAAKRAAMPETNFSNVIAWGDDN